MTGGVVVGHGITDIGGYAHIALDTSFMAPTDIDLIISGPNLKPETFAVSFVGGCCIPPTVGDIDQSGGIDITDISVLIDNQFLTLTPLVCEDEGDVDLSGAVDITDISVLIDNQFLTLTQLPPCP